MEIKLQNSKLSELMEDDNLRLQIEADSERLQKSISELEGVIEKVKRYNQKMIDEQVAELKEIYKKQNNKTIKLINCNDLEANIIFISTSENKGD